MPILHKVNDQNMEKKSVTVDSYFLPHIRLLKIAEHLLTHAKELKDKEIKLQEQKESGILKPQIGTFVDDVIRLPVDEFLISSFLMSIFSFEAYINTVGDFIIDDFKDNFDNKTDKNKRKNTKEKAKAIYKKLNIEFDLGQHPLQQIFKSFQYRDEWVHAKPIKNRGSEVYTDKREAWRAFWEGHKVECEKIITLEYVNCLLKNIKLVIELIRKKITEETLSYKHKNDFKYFSMNGVLSSEMI